METDLQLGRVFLAISLFLIFVAWDICNACKRKDKWIQGTGLTLTALTIQFLGYFDVQNINLFGKLKMEELEMLLKKQSSADIARLVFCTFLGCVLPGVAFAGSGGSWSNIAALAVSLCIHMATEVHVLQNVDLPIFSNGGAMFISCSMLLLVAAISLVLYLGLAVINCKLARDRLSLKIPKMISGNVKNEKLAKEGEIFKMWAIVRGCQQEFWLISSVFTPAAAMIVTTCVAVVGSKLISRQSLLHGSSNSVTWTLCLQCVFIVIGWIILIWRWVIHFLLCILVESDTFYFADYLGCIWAYEIRFCRLVYLLIRTTLDLSMPDNVSNFKSILTNVWKALRILGFSIFITIMLPVGFFFVLILSLIVFNYFCWILSCLLVWSVIFVAASFHFIAIFRNLMWDAEEELITEAYETLYVANSSIEETKRDMSKANEQGQSASNILNVLKHSVSESREVIKDQLSVTENEYAGKGVWKMTAVAAISILAEQACSLDSNEIAKNAIQAYREVQDLLKFLDFPDNITVNPMNMFDSGSSRAYQMSLEADIIMQKIERHVKIKKHCCAALTFEEVAGEFAENQSSSLQPRIKFRQHWSGKRRVDNLSYGEGTVYLKIKSMKCVQDAIKKESHRDEREVVNRAVTCLGDIVACAIFRLEDVLPEYCAKWAGDFKEENIRKALELQEKFRAIKDKWIPAEIAKKTEPEDNNIPDEIELDVQKMINCISRE